MPNDRPPLTIQETIRALGVSDSTVGRMLASGQLREHGRDPAGRILIDAASIDAAAVALGRAELAGSELQREIAPQMAALSQVMSTLAETIQRQEERIADLSLQLGAAQAEARLLPARAVHAEQRAAELEQKLDQAREENTRLRETLARLEAGAYASDQGPSTGKRGILARFFGWLGSRE